MEKIDDRKSILVSSELHDRLTKIIQANRITMEILINELLAAYDWDTEHKGKSE